NSVTNNTYRGISLSGSDYTLNNNNVTDNYYGIYLYNSNNSALNGNNVTDNYYGIYLYNSNNSALIDSSVTGNDIYGIYLYNSSNNTLTCNNVEDNDDYGICLDNSNNNILTDNNVTDNVDNGVLLSGSNNNILTDNSVTNNVDDGVLLSGSSNNTLTCNNVEDNDDYGICLDNSNNNTLNDNIISNNSDIGLYMETSRYNNLENNLMNNNSYNFGVEEDYCGLNIEDAFANNISITNLVDGKPVYYLVGNTSGIEINSSSNAGVVYLINCENVLVEGLHLENNNHGLLVYNSTDILVFENNASNNIYGMILSSSGGNTLSKNTVLGNIKSGILIVNSEDSILTGNIASANGREASLVSASAEKVLVTENGSEELSLDSELIYSDGKKAPVGASASYHIPAGIGLINSPACILTENVARNYNYGIYLKTSRDSNLMNNTAQNNNYYGIFLMESSNSNLTENIARNNSYSGICQVMSGSSSLTGNIALNNSKGIYLDSSSGSTLTENIVRNNSYGIYLKMSDNSNLTGNAALKNDYGIYTEYSNYCNLTENNGSNNEICGFSLRRSYYCNLAENNGSNNEECGICLQESEYCNLTENNALNNIYVDDPEYFHISVENSGIYLENSNYCNLIENNARNNSYGICLFMSGGSILTGNTVSSNKNPSIPIRGLEVDPAGIFLLGSIYNQLINNEASNNCVGINLFYSSKITLSENVILANDLSGVLLKDSGDNELFNNKFNNRNNTIFEGRTVGIIWNTTKTTGTNIVDGPCLGGNYWGTPNGTGWSQNCTDVDGDGFCDTPYNITDTFTDYLPLKEIPGSDNENESGSSGGSSHTPHYIPVSSKSAGVQTVEDGQQKARAGQETHIDLKGADSGVLGVSFTSEKYSGIVVAMVEVLDEKAAVSEIEDEIREVGEEIDASGSAKIPKGIILRYMNIKVGNERFENSENLDRGVVTFKVPKTWIKENRIDESTIALNRFHDGKWNRLSSEKTGEDEEFVYFKAETPGFSLYSITGDNLRTEVSNISENTEKSSAPAPETRTEDKQETPKSAPGFGVLLAGIGLLLSVMSVRKNRPE
ncbi:MAG: NosD domain-containing protein, partial [Methanosarcinaceae archaeon]|nr:NosD domain-containing protein [Methanosarcinaceae archaeon]